MPKEQKPIYKNKYQKIKMNTQTGARQEQDKIESQMQIRHASPNQIPREK
jgi:hypothetical protein